MTQQLKDLDAFAVLGVQSCSPYETDDFGPVWQEFAARSADIEPHSVDGACYGVNFDPRSGGPPDYLAGMAVHDVTVVPAGLVLREVPGGAYAVFGCTVATIHATYERIFHEWLPQGERVQDPSRPCFERYGPGTTSDADEVVIHIPVLPEQETA